MKNVTIQDIADAIGVSRVTIWKVFAGKGGVSEDIRHRVIQTARDMGYTLPAGLEPVKENSVSMSVTISIAVSRPETSSFWMNTIHEIAKEASKNNINMIYTYLPTSPDESFELPSSLSNGQVQGVIILNVYNEQLIKKLNALPIPKIFMDTCTSLPFEKLAGDLLLIEGRSPIADITRQILKTGATKIGFIGDINYAQTNFERYYGFKDTMRDRHLPIDDRFCFISHIGADSYTEEISNFLDGLKEYPEAFICASDYVANIVSNQLIARGKRIPEDIMISGFDCVSDFVTPVPLTSVRVNNKDIGKSLANKLMYRISYPNASRELSYIFPTVVYNTSTKA